MDSNKSGRTRQAPGANFKVRRLDKPAIIAYIIHVIHFNA
ncbi:hypothetical protein ANRL1_02494 [Anaerolineae bacterium]|nr:hypothetical protein ANRL1_02494 [Anaerolineae bacterium]